MSAVHVTSYLSDHVDGRVNPSMKEKVKSHLVFCNACRHTLYELEQNKKALQSMPSSGIPEPKASELLSQLLEELQRGEQSPVDSIKPENAYLSSILQPKTLKVGGATILLLLAIMGLYFRSTSQKPLPTSPTVLPPTLDRPQSTPNPIPSSHEEAPVSTKSTPGTSGPQAVAPPPNASEDKKSSNGIRNNSNTIDSQVFLKEFNGNSSGVQAPFYMAISHPNDWKKHWKKHAENITPTPALPEIDFSQNDVLVYHLGTRPNGGTQVRITQIEETTWNGKPAQIVHTSITEPPSGSIQTQVMSQPYTMKIVPKFKGRTFFRHNR